MTVASELARLTETIDSANELFLSDQIKMIDVGHGVRRPTNAKVLADLAAQMSGSLIYTTLALGLAGTGSGGYFSVTSQEELEYIVLYRNDAGIAVEIDRYPNTAAIRAVIDNIDQVAQTREVLSIVDEVGFSMFSVLDDGTFGTKQNSLGADGIKNSAVDILALPGDSVLLVDEFGFVVADLFASSAPEADESDAAEIQHRNAENLAVSCAVRGEFNSEIQRPTAKYNHILTFGQSLAAANETWPALSKAPFGGSLMYGDSPRPNGRYVANFTPLNGPALKPLKAVVQSEDGSALLSDAQVSALAPGAGNEGEGPDVALTNFARKQFLQHHGLAADPSRLFVASSCGVSGRTIEQLSKGADPEYYLRLVQAAQGVKSIANSEGATYCIPAIVWMQGEFNYVSDRGGDTSKAGYKAKLLAQSEIWKTEIVKGIANQDAPPAIITYQTGASFTRDDNDLSIGMAQLELSNEQPNWYLASPYYPYTDKGAHLDPNGSRWLGLQIGKVFHRVVTMGQGWKPLSPRRATVTGTEVLIDFHVPCPPLAWGKPFVALTATDYADKGFRVIDSVGTIGIRSVEIAADTVIKIVLARVPASNVRIQYATLTASQGNGCLRDSDPTVAMYNYEYSAGSGQYAAANIPELVGKPYPLHNWCVAFSINPEV